MNNRQRNRQKMSVNVESYLIEHKRIWDPLPNSSQYLSKLAASNNKIDLLSKEQLFDQSGVLKSKQRVKGLLITFSLDIARKVLALGQFTQNDTLVSALDFPESELRYAGDQQLRKYATGIYERALEYLKHLEEYGVTAKELEKMLSLKQNFEALISEVDFVNAELTEYTAQLSVEIKAMDAILEKIDGLVELIRYKEPKFYNEYKRLRKVKNLGNGSMMLKGLITDADTKEPIKNAEIKLKLNGNGNGSYHNGNGVIHKKSAEKGGFYIKSMEDGTYSVLVTKSGYTQRKAEVSVSQGDFSRLEIELVAV